MYYERINKAHAKVLQNLIVGWNLMLVWRLSRRSGDGVHAGVDAAKHTEAAALVQGLQLPVQGCGPHPEDSGAAHG